MDVEFIIPLKKEDLLKKDPDCYSVKLISFTKAIAEVSDLRFTIEKNGCDSIVEGFDKCFSFLYEAEEVTFTQLVDFYDEVIEEYLKRLCSYVEQALELDPISKKRALNVVKMLLYMFSMYLKTYENKLIHQKDQFISEPKRAKIKVKNKIKSVDTWPWCEKKLNAFTVIYSFLQLPICKLWQTKIVEESFIGMIAGSCYKTFENSEINLVKCKPLRDSVCQVLSILVVNFNHTQTFLARTVELMKNCEHSASAIAISVLIMHQQFSCNSMLKRVLTQLFDVALEDPQNMGKSISIFISELGENHPQLFISCVDNLMEFLSIDAYSIRNSVMVTFCEMIIHCFSKENLDAESITTRNEIIKVMLSQLHDENAYVRSKIVHLWAKLASSSCIPIDCYIKLLRNIRHRLLDKSTYVSKNAVNFFTMALEHNPYGGKLRLKELNKEKDSEMLKLKEFMKKQPLPPEDRWSLCEIEIVNSITDYFKEQNDSNKIQEIQDTNSVEISSIILIIGNLINNKLYSNALSLLQNSESVFPESREIRCNFDKTDQVAYYVATFKKIYLRACELSPETLVPDYYENINKMESTKTVVKYLDDCTNFIECINKASETIYKLMFSINPTEVLESIEFFSVAYKFHIENSEQAVQDMLLLVNSNNPEMKSAVAKAYSCLYLSTGKTEARAKAAQIAHRLINLVKSIDQDQILALEELLTTWVGNELDKEFIALLFEKVIPTPQVKSVSSDRNASLFLVNMVAEVNDSVVCGNIVHLKKLLNSDSDNFTIKLVCSLFQKLAVKKGGKPVKYKKGNEIFVLLTEVLHNKYSSDEAEFDNMVISVIDLIFKLCYKPEELCHTILCDMYEKMIDCRSKSDNFVNSSDDMMNISGQMLEKIFVVCGHIVFKKWQYCDKDLFNCLKSCQDGVVQEKDPNQSLDEFGMEADTAIADDALYEKITAICEKFTSEEGTITQHICDLVLAVCHNNDDKISSSLKSSAAIALAKFMFTSVAFCETNVQLYVTLMDRSKCDAVRSALVLGFGDLLCQFPNTVEPWTQYLYLRLKDHSESVRMNTVSVLCHLINREMIKVRGQFAELLLHLEDPQPIIAEKVSSLLLDLSRKGNTIYNVIPDIISKLSNPERESPVASSTFKLIIGRLFELITKERQNDLLVEKLCSRLRESKDQRQWDDLSYCLSQIRFSEKSIRKLTDALPTFTERLSNPFTHQTILTIIHTCSKSTKPSLREAAHEASAKLEELMTVKDENITVSLTSQNTNSPAEESKKNVSEENSINGNCEENIDEIKTTKPVTRNKISKTTATATVPRSARKPKKTNQTNPTITRSTRKKKVKVYSSFTSSDEDN